jgi:hypothetical protein
MRFATAALTAAAVLGTLLGAGTLLPAGGAVRSPAVVAASPSARAATHLRSASAPLDSAEAWYFCRSEVYRFVAGIRPGADPFSINPYRTRFIAPVAHHRWKVQLVGRLGQGVEAGRVNAAWCVVGGTVGAPKVISYLYPR